MTYKVWERKFKKEAKALPKSERERALEYYREMRDEMASRGMTEEKILAELGSPERCARRAMTPDDGFSFSEERTENKPVQKAKGGISFAGGIGLILVTVMFVLPLSAVLFSIVAAFAAVCVSGAAVGVAGIAFAIGYPLVISAETAAVGIGAGLITSGVGLLLFVGFFFVTKYTAIGMAKILKAIYKRG